MFVIHRLVPTTIELQLLEHIWNHSKLSISVSSTRMVTVDFSMLSLATYFVRDHSDAPHKFSDADVIKMLEYLIDNIFVEFGGWIFQQTIRILKGINCASLLAVFILV